MCLVIKATEPEPVTLSLSDNVLPLNKTDNCHVPTWSSQIAKKTKLKNIIILCFQSQNSFVLLVSSFADVDAKLEIFKI